MLLNMLMLPLPRMERAGLEPEACPAGGSSAGLPRQLWRKLSIGIFKTKFKVIHFFLPFLFRIGCYLI